MLDRKTPPPFVHTASFDLLHPEQITLANGAGLFVISGGSQEVMKVELVFKAGKWFETRAGASHFASTLLNKGTKSKTSFEIAQTFDQYGAHIEVSSGFDFVSVSVYTLNLYLEPVLLLLKEIINEAVFPDKELDLHKSVFLQNLKVNQEKTSYLASKAFRSNLFGPEHPYGKETDEKEINNLERSDVVNHFNSYYNHFQAFVSGKVNNAQKSLLKEILDSISRGEPGTANKTFPASNHFEKKIDKEGSVQATIRAGKISLSKKDADYKPAVFVTHILGGYFGSRLMKNIREEKGLTYGISASINALQESSYFLIGTDVNKENVDETIGEIRKELKILRTEKVSTSELETAKNHFIGSLQAEITTPFAHADKIKSIVLSDLKHDFYQSMIYAVDAMTHSQIMEITEKHFHEDSVNVVSVG